MSAGPVPFACYYAYSPELTGGPRTVLSLLSRLDPARFRPVLFTQHESPLAEGARALGVSVELVPPPAVLDVRGGRGLRYSWRDRAASLRALGEYTRQLRGVMQRHAVRGLWARNAKAVMLAGTAARREGLPVVWDVGFERPAVGLMRAIHAFALYSATRVVTQSASQSAELVGPRLARLLRSRFRALPPGLDDARAALLREAWARGATQRTGRVVLCAGTLNARKNQMMLLRALPTLLARQPDAVVRLAGVPGDERYADGLRAFVRAHGLEDRVDFLGWRDDVPSLLAEADVVVLCSRAEGVPHVLREALFAGVPVVGTPVGGIPDGVLEGETGFLVPVDDDMALADRLTRLLGDPELRASMGERSVRVGTERFSAARWAAAYQDVLAEVFR